MSELRRRREAMNMTRDVFIAEFERVATQLGFKNLGISAKQLARWESDNPPQPRPPAVQVLKRIFGCSLVEQLGFASASEAAGGEVVAADEPRYWDLDVIIDDQDRLASKAHRSDVNRREFLIAGGSLTGLILNYFLAEPTRARQSSALDHTSIDFARLRADLQGLRLRDAARGSGALLRTSQEATALLFDALGSSRSSELDRPQLLEVAGESASFTGWLEFDMGNEVRAQRYLAVGLRAARHVGDRLGASTAFTFMAIQQYNLCNWDEALVLSTAARRVLDGLDCPHVIASLWTREARALAGKGDAAGCDAALAKAFESFADGPGSDHPPSVNWVSLGELHGQASGCAALLGDVNKAQEEMDAAVSSYGPAAARSSSLHMLRLAVAYAEAGAFRDAAAVGGDALDLGAGVSSFRYDEVKGDLVALLRAGRGAVKKVALFERHEELVRSSYPRSVRNQLLARAS